MSILTLLHIVCFRNYKLQLQLSEFTENEQRLHLAFRSLSFDCKPLGKTRETE